MKNKIILVSTIVLTIVLIVNLGLFIYNHITVKALRYSTPTEAFDNSCHDDSELLDILQDQEVALLIYKDKDGIYSNHIIAKDSRGWTSLDLNYKNKREVLQDNGFIYLKEVQNKNVIQLVITVESDEDVPVLSDSLKSTFLSNSYELDSGRKLFFAFSVIEERISKDYWIKIGDQKIGLH